MDQSQESDKIIQFYLNQQIRKVEEDKQQEQQLIEFERNKVKLQVWELLFKNNPQQSQLISKSNTQSSDQQDKYQILDQIIAKYEENQSKIFEKSTKTNYFQKQIPENTHTPEDQSEYEEQFEEYEPIEEDIQIEQTIQDPQKLSVLLRSQKENSYQQLNQNQQSLKSQQQDTQISTYFKGLNLKQSKLDSFLKDKVPSIIENQTQMHSLTQNNNKNITQDPQNSKLKESLNETVKQSKYTPESYLKLSKQQKFPTEDSHNNYSQEQSQQVEEQFSDLQDIQDNQDELQSDEDENHNKFYQFSIKFDDDTDKDKLKKFDQLKKKKILEMEELKNLRQIRNNQNKDSVVKRDPSPKMMPSASIKRIPREEIVKPQEIKQEVKTPQTRTTTRKSPMPRAKETAHFNNLPFSYQDINADRSISCDKQKNNKKMLKNAITYACLAGEPNRKEREFMLQKLESSEADHFILLFKAIGRTDVKGVYSMIGNTAQLLFSSGRCPSLLTPDMIRGYYKYDSGGKQFKEIEGNRGFTIMVDAVQLRK